MQNAATPIPAGYGTISKPAGLGLDYGTQSFLMTAMLDTALAAGTDATQLAATNGVCVCVCVCVCLCFSVCVGCVCCLCVALLLRGTAFAHSDCTRRVSHEHMHNRTYMPASSTHVHFTHS